MRSAEWSENLERAQHEQNAVRTRVSGPRERDSRAAHTHPWTLRLGTHECPDRTTHPPTHSPLSKTGHDRSRRKHAHVVDGSSEPISALQANGIPTFPHQRRNGGT